MRSDVCLKGRKCFLHIQYARTTRRNTVFTALMSLKQSDDKPGERWSTTQKKRLSSAVLCNTAYKGATPQGWFVFSSLFRGTTGGRHSGPGTVSNLPRLRGRLDGWIRTGVRGLALHSLPRRRALTDRRVRVGDRPYHIQKVLRTIPVVTDNKKKTPISRK